jgi:hypothetical protein
MINRKFLLWSLAFLFVTLALFFLNNVLEWQFIKKNIPLVLLTTAVVFLFIGLLVRESDISVVSKKRVAFTIVICLILSALLFVFFEKGLILTLSFFFVWLIGGLSLYTSKRNNTES